MTVGSEPHPPPISDPSVGCSRQHLATIYNRVSEDQVRWEQRNRKQRCERGTSVMERPGSPPFFSAKRRA